MLLVLNVTILHSQVSIKNIAGITYSTERFSCLICPQILLASFWLQRQDYRLEGIWFSISTIDSNHLWHEKEIQPLSL